MTIDPSHHPESAGEEAGGATHPADRPAEPDHPMQLEGQFCPGDVKLMARCMIEELLLLGTPLETLRAMSRDANYQALFAAREQMGHEAMEDLLDQTYGRIGRHRHRDSEHEGDIQPTTLTVGKS